MIAIPNMEKPKACYYCPLEQLSECRLLDNKFVEEIDPNDCPLIEIDDLEYQAYKEFMAMLLEKIEERILYGERRE